MLHTAVDLWGAACCNLLLCIQDTGQMVHCTSLYGGTCSNLHQTSKPGKVGKVEPSNEPASGGQAKSSAHTRPFFAVCTEQSKHQRQGSRRSRPNVHDRERCVAKLRGPSIFQIASTFKIPVYHHTCSQRSGAYGENILVLLIGRKYVLLTDYMTGKMHE
jgi:hypothetical protein